MLTKSLQRSSSGQETTRIMLALVRTCRPGNRFFLADPLRKPVFVCLSCPTDPETTGDHCWGPLPKLGNRSKRATRFGQVRAISSMQPQPFGCNKPLPLSFNRLSCEHSCPFGKKALVDEKRAKHETSGTHLFSLTNLPKPIKPGGTSWNPVEPGGTQWNPVEPSGTHPFEW